MYSWLNQHTKHCLLTLKVYVICQLYHEKTYQAPPTFLCCKQQVRCIFILKILSFIKYK